MNKIPTAETVLEYLIPDCKTAMTAKQYKNALTAIKMHSQYYVKAALEAAADKAEIINIDGVNSNGENCDFYEVDKKSILNSYPENLIV